MTKLISKEIREKLKQDYYFLQKSLSMSEVKEMNT